MSTEFQTESLESLDPEEEHRHDPDPKLRDLPITLGNLARIPLLAFIRLYQKTFSRTLPANTCRFYPTCSHYSFQAIHTYGLFRGGWLAFRRILKCQPFNPGGYDPVP